MKTKQSTIIILRCIVFLFVLIIVLTWFYENLKKHELIDTTENGLFHQPKQSVDIIYAGNSHVYAAVKPSQIEEKTGLHGFVLSTSDLNAEGVYYYLKAALKNQTPKYVALETYSFSLYDKSDAPDSLTISYKLADLPFWDRLGFILDRIRTNRDSLEYVIFPIALVHENWEDPLSFAYQNKSVDNGWLPFDEVSISHPDILMQQADLHYFENIVMDEEAERFFYKIIQLLESKNIHYFFFTTPYFLTNSELPAYQYINDFVQKNNIPYINFSDNSILRELNFRRAYMHDIQHVTPRGASIVSDALADFINNKLS